MAFGTIRTGLFSINIRGGTSQHTGAQSGSAADAMRAAAKTSSSKSTTSTSYTYATKSTSSGTIAPVPPQMHTLLQQHVPASARPTPAQQTAAQRDAERLAQTAAANAAAVANAAHAAGAAQIAPASSGDVGGYAPYVPAEVVNAMTPAGVPLAADPYQDLEKRGPYGIPLKFYIAGAVGAAIGIAGARLLRSAA